MNELTTGWFYSDLGLLLRKADIDTMYGFPNNFTMTPPPEIPEGKFAVFDGAYWRIADEEPKPYIPPIEPWQVDQERDRRVSLGFIYNGKAFMTESQSQMNDILGKLGDATAAISIDNAQPGDLRWSDAEYDFAWSAADGTDMPMDAQTCLDFTRSAVRRKEKLVAAGLLLKAMSPIPQDYWQDQYWPPMDATAKAAQK